MNFSRIVTIVTLCSLSGVSFVGGFLGIFSSHSNNPSPPDDDKDATKPDPKTQKAKLKSQTAIATPEKLPNQQPHKAKKQQPSKGTAQKRTTQKLAKLPLTSSLSLPSTMEGNQKSQRQRSSSNPVWNRTKFTRSTGAIAAPETISSTQSVSARQEQPSTDATLAFMVPLKDIEGHWAQYYIENLASRGVVHGFPDGSFRPNQQITPSEFATITRNAFQGSSAAPTYYDLQFHTSEGVATRADAAAYVYQVLSKSEPALSVTRVEVNGEVAHPGAYSLAAASDPRLGRGNNFPTVSRAIQQAGGSLASADLRQVEVHRLTEMGTKRVIKVDIQKMRQTGDRTQDLVLQQDDKLVIPTAVSKAQPAISSPEKLSKFSKPTQPTPQPLKAESQLLEINTN
ncbi:S-layer homology domain-containing protein [Kovacikia minuta CCNUW1]|uniref:S-layer homology domain-containing protein n=1 Tax=Kovacikia minuta TaxID=2931930 RepID=UPI001CC8F9AC|nr:S-layer homology domain-containing protein [Kovacikia minuta]UBF23768.1 S-layer homology domain-containing protein [Kovacikia minuta CCNUW1]